MKVKARFSLFTSLCVVLFAASACSELIPSNDPQIFSVTPPSAGISAVSQSMEFNVDCDKTWSAHLALGLWASIRKTDPETGKIVVSATLNDGADSRSDTLVVKSGSKSVKVPVVQQGMNSIISPTSLTLSGMEPGVITVHASDDWTVEIAGTIDASWIEMDRTGGGKGDSKIKFQANAENLNVGDRNVLAKFTMGNDIFFATVTQKQTDAILKDPDKVELSNGAQNFSISLRYNVDYEVKVDCDWISRVSTKVLNTATETFNVSANSGTDGREGTITFTGNGITETVHVFQAECDQLAFLDGVPVEGSDFPNPRMMETDAAGGVFSVELRSNVEYDIIWPDAPWLISAEKSDAAKVRAVRNDVLVFEVVPNSSLQPRACAIMVKDHNSDLSATLLVSQGGCIPAFMDDDNYGIYEVSGGALFEYTPGMEQLAVYRRGGSFSFRIQNPESGGYLIIEGIPEDMSEPFGMTVRHNMSLGFPQENKYENIVEVRADGRKVWLYCEDGMGFIIKK